VPYLAFNVVCRLEPSFFLAPLFLEPSFFRGMFLFLHKRYFTSCPFPPQKEVGCPPNRPSPSPGPLFLYGLLDALAFKAGPHSPSRKPAEPRSAFCFSSFCNPFSLLLKPRFGFVFFTYEGTPVRYFKGRRLGLRKSLAAGSVFPSLFSFFSAPKPSGAAREGALLFFSPHDGFGWAARFTPLLSPSPIRLFFYFFFGAPL